MRAVVQRVTRARVTVDGEETGAIAAGYCVFLGVGPADNPATARRLAARIAALRICPDSDGRMNRDLGQIGGAVLVVSQFTLYADTSRGHRLSFIAAGPPEQAERLCEEFISALRERSLIVAAGRFGAHMTVEVVNDGPVTVVLTSGEPAWPADAG